MEMDIKKKELLLLNEQTFLSYERTAASVLVVGIVLFKFFHNYVILILASLDLLLAAIIFILGFYRFYTEKRRIKSEKFKPAE